MFILFCNLCYVDAKRGLIFGNRFFFFLWWETSLQWKFRGNWSICRSHQLQCMSNPVKERRNKCWIGRELDCAAILSALVSSMATKRPEMTPQETQVSQGGTFPRSLLHSVIGWKEPMGCGSDGHQRPPCAHRCTSLPGLQSSPS